MEDLKQFCLTFLQDANFDSLAVSKIDFSQNKYTSFQINNNKYFLGNNLLFDLASLTKPFTLSAIYLSNPEIFNDSFKLLLNHRAGLPSWAKLSKHSWKEQVLSYKIVESETVYSDLSALRLMLEIEKKSDYNFQEKVSTFWSDEIYFWKDLPEKFFCPNTGFRKGYEINGVVNDENAYLINQFCSHAGLFGSIKGVSETILKFNKELNLIKTVTRDLKSHNYRFSCGWDTSRASKESLAGDSAGVLTFGHLGFTGTSIWTDPDRNIGYVILSNATRDSYYSRDKLNSLRKIVGNYILTGILKP